MAENGGKRFMAMAIMVVMAAAAVEATDCNAKCFANCKDAPLATVCVRGCSKNCENPFSLAQFHCTLGCARYNCNKFASGTDKLERCVDSCSRKCSKILSP